jgi:hypothetical protein
MRSMLFAICVVILAGAASASPIDSQDRDEQGSPGFENSNSHAVDVNNHDRDGDVELGHHDRGDDDGGDLEVGDHDGQGDCGGGGTDVVPEPSTLVLAGLGIVGLAISGRRK